jgi:putative OPT family oligopeptide transporter
MTLKAVGLGLALSLVFGAANAYLGLKAGQTVAATIPAAVIAMAVFRLPLFRGTIQEQNIARTAASVGEALVAGAIFTIPAFVLAELDGGRPWQSLRGHYWEATLILLVGGLAGIFFIIVLRRPLCVEAGLPFPESVASVGIVKAGAQAGRAARLIFSAMGLGGLVQFLKSDKGLPLLREYASGYLRFAPSLVQHFDFRRDVIGQVRHAGGIAWTTPALSPALIGIGYIIGPRLASVNVSGGLLAWWVLIPLLVFFDPDLPARLSGGEVTDEVIAFTVWYNVVRPIAVGAMLVAAARTLLSLRSAIASSVGRAFRRARPAGGEAAPGERTERDIPGRWVVAALAALLVPIAGIYRYYTGSWRTALIAAAVMMLAGFLLSAVGAYLVGLVGVSNQPVSGLTLAALVVAALVLVAIGVTGLPGVAAVLGVAAVVCTACCVSGSLIQDLKAGQMLEGTPWKMQLVEILAVILLAFFLMGPIIALHEANLASGGIGGRDLPAPQAGLMAQLAKGIVGGEMAWGLLGIGAAFGAALILFGARAPMLVAVGMYLPFETSSAIFLGGLLRRAAEAMARRLPASEKAQTEENGTLLASGLIAGEAIVGILLAVVFLAGIPSAAELFRIGAASEISRRWGGWLSVAAFAILAWVLVRIPVRGPAALSEQERKAD